jgi:hypothetical protein
MNERRRIDRLDRHNYSSMPLATRPKQPVAVLSIREAAAIHGTAESPRRQTKPASNQETDLL